MLTALLAFNTPASAACFYFTKEHVDVEFVWDGSKNQLSLGALDHTSGKFYASNEFVIVCPESMKLALPAGTPLGVEGDPMWILPQHPHAGVPYVGVCSGGIPAGVFYDPLGLRITRVEGPGQLIVWQVGGPNGFNVLIDTRDGISANDSLRIPVGGHEHYNWGFTTSGVYRVHFQAAGRLIGQTTNIVSPETPFTFHILPLRPFELWAATHWPCECDPNIIAAGADPDGDRAANALEYATGTDPRLFTTNARPEFSFVSANGRTYGAVTFPRAKAATDAALEVVASDSLAAPNWQPITNLHGLADLGTTEHVTIRDGAPADSVNARFYRLRIRLD